MKRRKLLFGVLALAAAPLLPQEAMFKLHLNESPDQVRKVMGQPALVAEINSDFRSWQYRVGDIDHDSFSHALVFRNSTNTLVSYSQTFEQGIDMKTLFPESATTSHRYPANGPVEMIVHVRDMPGQPLLLAFGSVGLSGRVDQLMLIDRSVLHLFYPWLAKEL